MPAFLSLTDSRDALPMFGLAAIGLVAVLAPMLRVVYRGERLVASRRGRVRRVLGLGLAIIPSGGGRTGWVTLESADLGLARTRRWDVEVDSLQVTGVATQVSATMHDPARQRR